MSEVVSGHQTRGPSRPFIGLIQASGVFLCGDFPTKSKQISSKIKKKSNKIKISSNKIKKFSNKIKYYPTESKYYQAKPKFHPTISIYNQTIEIIFSQNIYVSNLFKKILTKSKYYEKNHIQENLNIIK